MQFKRKMMGIALAVAVAGLSGLSAMTTEAAISGGPFNTADEALNNAPQGARLTGYFKIADGISNSAGVVSATQATGTVSDAAVRITEDKPNETGAVWTNDNSFDLTRNQTASMWIFNGGTYGATLGDGMAFVLQNAGDPNQFSTSGESLGVWGIDPRSTTYSASALAATAIPNSWALEFDTYNNSTKTEFGYNFDNPLSSFDLGDSYTAGTATGTKSTINGPHLASNYPGEADTYQPMGNNWGSTSKGSGYYYTYGLKHLGLISTATLNDDKWHHVTVSYQAPTGDTNIGKVTYTFNDKDPQTGLARTSAVSRTVPLDLSKFHLDAGQTKIRWGFTGSTGSYSENNIVIFDQIPDQVQTTASANMTYDQDGQAVTVANNAKIPGGSDVTLNYTAQRSDGNEDWRGVNAEIMVPQHITIGSTATVTYEDGTTRTANITADGGGYKRVNLARNGDGSGLTLTGKQAVKISIKGIADNPASGKTFSSGNMTLTSYFEGENAVASASVPQFTIAYAKQPVLKLGLNQTAIHVNAGSEKSTTITGSVTTTDQSLLTDGDVKLTPTVTSDNGTTPTLTEETLSSSNPAKKFSYNFSTKAWPVGTYTVKMKATNISTGDVTSTVPVSVVVGGLSFGENSAALSYTSQLGGSSKIVPRANDHWGFTVNDTLAAGTDWKLYASATPLTSDTVPGNTLSGNLVYSDGTTEQDLASGNILVADRSSAGDNAAVNIASDWHAETGILLRLNSSAMQGSYTGKVDWTLSDTP